MVGIYGGSFTHGFASEGYYGPQHIIEQGVLVVTFNYRVGPFGKPVNSQFSHSGYSTE